MRPISGPVLVTALAGFFLQFAATPAHASSIVPGDVFQIAFTDTSVLAVAFLDSNPSLTTTISNPDFGTVTSADFTLGSLVGPGVFSISQVTNIVGTPPFLTVDLSTLFFHADLLGLTGTITDTYLGGGGGLHSDLLTAFDPPSLGSPGTWILSDDHVTGGFTVVTEGTYLATPVPEPTSMLLLGTGLALVARITRRKRSRSAS